MTATLVGRRRGLRAVLSDIVADEGQASVWMLPWARGILLNYLTIPQKKAISEWRTYSLAVCTAAILAQKQGWVSDSCTESLHVRLQCWAAHLLFLKGFVLARYSQLSTALPLCTPLAIPSVVGALSKCHKPGLCRNTLTGFFFFTMTSWSRSMGNETRQEGSKTAGTGWMLIEAQGVAPEEPLQEGIFF